ncbi:alpha-L-fucosidase [Lacticaseibacillus yichunensis]|uniref:alpha-L-fucosidase n=1 Tax=Lacticaseibacillus yichunensis TaxID=2486015 RepID=A0ABW4CRZ7_9LACO|nr:alpha-L-fucosidase [Lacticaseibacillus yichunensis]
MTEETTPRADIETAKTADWTEADFADYPEFPTLQKRWDWFQDQKIGLLMHWGLYAVAGIVESWQLSDEDTWARGKHPFRPNMKQLKHDYWGLAKQFDPENYDPAAWANLFKEAGIRYTILTTKHHDGFTLYDTQESDYKVTAPGMPYATGKYADLFKAYAEAMRAAGITPGAYYSKADWHHDDYWRHDDKPKGRGADYDPKDDPARWQRFVDFVHAQLLEIARNYGPLGMLWLDAGWVNTDREPLDFDTLMPKIREAQPDILIVDRTLGGRYENYVTPERAIPTLATRPTMPWESNIPLSHDWGYVPHGDYKSINEIIDDILKVVTLGGNIVLGIGPKPDGTLPREGVRLLKQLGGWLAINGQGIYGTRGVADALVENAQAQRLYITQNQTHYFLFPQRKVPQQAIDLKALGLADTISAAHLLGYAEADLVIKDGLLFLPGGLRQKLTQGIALIKK